MTIAYFNGKIVEMDQPVVPIDERGHQFGDGVYEVIKVYKNKPFMMKEHMDRLYKSAEAIKLTINESRQEMEELLHDLIQKSGLEDAEVYLQVTRGIAPRNHLFPTCPSSLSVIVKPPRHLPEKARTEGVKVHLTEDLRWKKCYIKSLNLLPNTLAKQEAYENGCFEAILVRDGYITEGSSSNFFLVKNGELVTTPLSDSILHGITRLAVKQIAETDGIPFVEKHLTPDDLFEADEAFVTSTGVEVAPITTADGHTIGSGQAGPISKKLYEKFIELTK
ncbi:D-alanine transaminase [Bacillus ectoiniformans]|uniref:D-amino-acid transaminase n=1 Tax=Bacillus ectoiniformans TaxID=1494429 RepID=UPI00195C0DF0|nr:D-amino-acid transaminase [Bacillus ectoiniformans]MBM7648251.1 D-alanine transaminase [Bacillus ectoiniformans]